MEKRCKKFWIIKTEFRERTLQCPLCGHDEFRHDIMSAWIETGEYSTRMHRYICDKCDNVILNLGPLCKREASN